MELEYSCVHNSLPLVRILGQITLVHILTHHFFKINFIIIFLFPSGSLTKTFCVHFSHVIFETIALTYNKRTSSQLLMQNRKEYICKKICITFGLCCSLPLALGSKFKPLSTEWSLAIDTTHSICFLTSTHIRMSLQSIPSTLHPFIPPHCSLSSCYLHLLHQHQHYL